MKKIIYKQNCVIRGHFKDNINNDITMLSEFDIDVLNTIYYMTQQKLFCIHPIEYNNIDIRTVTFNFTDIGEMLNTKSKKCPTDIKKSLENIFNVELHLKNFIDPVSGLKIKEQFSRVIEDIKYIDNNQNQVILQLSSTFMVNILRHTDKQSGKKIGNFTPIDATTVRGLRSKYAKRLYEHLSSYLGLGQIDYLVMDIEKLNKLYGTEHTALSRLSEITKRAYPSVRKKIDFSFESYKKDKKIVFKFKNSKEEIGNE